MYYGIPSCHSFINAKTLKLILRIPLFHLRKRLNYKLIEWQKRRRMPIVAGYPYWLTIDPTNICNLRCVFCPTGQGRGARPSAVLSYNDFKRIINTLGPYLIHIDFCNWGEPLLNKDISRMIAYARKFAVTTKVDTNLNVRLDERLAGELVRSGLERMNISLDGASQATYEKYRRDGNFQMVVDNMRLLTETKKRLHVTTPHLHWQFLVFRHNEHEIDTARRMYREIGADSIGFTAPFCSPEWVSTIDEYNNYLVKDDGVQFKKADGVCGWLWDGIAINANGSVSPCCSVEDQKDDFGNFFDKPFWMLWNSKHYRVARAYVGDSGAPLQQNVCTRCDHRGASNHAGIKEPR
jgi:radical SAM protein with 4Fe4S-binding SPASM domain